MVDGLWGSVVKKESVGIFRSGTRGEDVEGRSSRN